MGGRSGVPRPCRRGAAGVAPSVHMNPVLLKPQSEVGSQIVVQGRVTGTAKAREYQAFEARADAPRAGQFCPYAC